jgi:hypothetical protein
VKKGLKAALLALGVSCLASGCGCHTVPPQPPAECKLDVAPSFAPAEGSAASADLERAHATPRLREGLEGEDLVAHCKQQWNDIIQHLHCSKELAALCDKNCPGAKCKEPPHSEAVMKKCRADSLPVFAAKYPTCAGYQLCGKEVEPAEKQCP